MNAIPERRHTTSVLVGTVKVGHDAPIVVQSMTNTDTANVAATVAQVTALAQAGSEIVRVTVNNEAAAKAVYDIKNRLLAQQITVPLVGDFHFNGHKLLALYPDCAMALDKYRINPGNVGRGAKKDAQFAAIIDMACRYQKPVRIGVNWGSLDGALLASMMDDNAKAEKPLEISELTRQALIRSALTSAAQAEDYGLPHDHIILSVKVSDAQDLIAVYRQISRECDYPLHLGLTEAGMGVKGVVASSAALAVLLQEGIGDTIRISLTPAPGEARTQEVLVAQELLQALKLRRFAPAVVACPGCGRTTSDYFQHLAQDIERYLREHMPVWERQYPGVETLTVAVMGCVVNGPGESQRADIGISLPGTGEVPVAPVYIDGQKAMTLKGDRIAAEFQAIVEDYIARRYGAAATH